VWKEPTFRDPYVLNAVGDVPAGKLARLSANANTVEGNSFDPYGSGSRHHGNDKAVQIRTNDGHLVDVLYIAPDAKIGRDTVVVAGETVLGTSADLSKTYGNSVPNHIHLQTQKGGRFRDPTPYIKD
jgi:hypothetical protein